tara:strand:- start:282 stop:644 length:363 start_codon:yes stop_codon:yes gene_type:complete
MSYTPFKMRKPMIEGTKAHKSALKQNEEMEKNMPHDILGSPAKQKKNEGPTTNSRIEADQEENPKEINAVDPVTGGNNAEYEREVQKLHALFKTGQISANELRERKKALIARLRAKLPKN